MTKALLNGLRAGVLSLPLLFCGLALLFPSVSSIFWWLDGVCIGFFYLPLIVNAWLLPRIGRGARHAVDD